MRLFRVTSPSWPSWSSAVLVERVVVVLTPLFAAAAGAVTSAVAQLIPGVTFSKTDVTALFITGATAGLSVALKWLHGHQKLVATLRPGGGGAEPTATQGATPGAVS